MTYPPMPVKPQKVRKPVTDTLIDLFMAVLAVATLGVSGWSLGTLLHDVGAPWLFAWAGVGVFDVPALIAALLVHQRRADPWQALGAYVWMTLSLVASAVVNGAHGAALGGWPVAMILGAAPLAFDVMFSIRYRVMIGMVWLVFRKQAWSRLKQDGWERISIPLEDGSRFTVSGPPAEAAATVERIRNGSAQLTAHEPGSAQLTEPTDQVGELTRRLKDGERLTKASAAGILGVSEATAGRRLREARERVGGGYL